MAARNGTARPHSFIDSVRDPNKHQVKIRRLLGIILRHLGIFLFSATTRKRGFRMNFFGRHEMGYNADFLSDLPFPQPLYSGASPYSTHFTVVGSQDLDVKSRPNLSTTTSLPKLLEMWNGSLSEMLYRKLFYFCIDALEEPATETGRAVVMSPYLFRCFKLNTTIVSSAHRKKEKDYRVGSLSATGMPLACHSKQFIGLPTPLSYNCSDLPIHSLARNEVATAEASTEQCRNERAGETGEPRENQQTSDVVRHDSHMLKSGNDPARNRTPFELPATAIGGALVVLLVCCSRLFTDSSEKIVFIVARLFSYQQTERVCVGGHPGITSYTSVYWPQSWTPTTNRRPSLYKQPWSEHCPPHHQLPIC
ncbi:hypothetical protein PR048_030326 [Dryococelus australis]|uniref:Uncharacterized protein n=1 Tax=Dryococelus australis TaxID=614101 RepID=A0ABQ9GCJ4_9NEOP|nr:hypothetical protein PR048_030326 [Dryococelus australis]